MEGGEYRPALEKTSGGEVFSIGSADRITELAVSAVGGGEYRLALLVQLTGASVFSSILDIFTKA